MLTIIKPDTEYLEDYIKQLRVEIEELKVKLSESTLEKETLTYCIKRICEKLNIQTEEELEKYITYWD